MSLFNEQEAVPNIEYDIVLVIDSDSLVYKAAHVGGKIYDNDYIPKEHFLFHESQPTLLETQMEVYHSMLGGIIKGVKDNLPRGRGIKSIQKHFTPKSRHSQAPNFRYKLVDSYNELNPNLPHPPYKASRKGMDLPDGLDELFDTIIAEDDVYLSDGCEADDVVSYLKIQDLEGVMLAVIDKDIWAGIPSGSLGHYNYNRFELIHTTDEEGLLFQYHQCLIGDSSDGIKSIHRYGIKTVQKDFPEYNKDTPKEVLAKFIEKGYTEEYALLMMQLVSMRQYNGVSIDLHTADIFE